MRQFMYNGCMNPPAPPSPGTILILNGTSSSGKTSLLKAVQDSFAEPYIDLGIDKFIWALPERYLERPLWDDVLGLADTAGETGEKMVRAMHRSILAASASGLNVVADHVLVSPRWVEECAFLFHDQPAYLIAVRCPLEILEQREKSRKNRTLGQARLQFERVHAHGVYDFEVDTSLHSPEECAEKVRQYILSGARPSALRKLMNTIR